MGLFRKNADASALYDKCMFGTPEFKISATDVSASLVSPFSLFCKYHADPSKRDPPDPFLQSLATKGIEHEISVLDSDYPDREEVTYDTPEEGFKLALESMAKGTNALSSPPLFYLPEGMYGYADVLEKRDGASACGKHHYVVREIKSARNIREHHVLQTAFYTLMLGRIQEYTPDYFLITNMDEHTVQYPYQKCESLLLEMIAQARRIQKGWTPSAVYGAGMHPWKNYCNETAIQNNDVSLITGIGESKRKLLAEVGLDTVNKVASSTTGALQQIKGVGKKTSVSYLNAARAITSGEYIRNAGEIDLPERGTEIFLDLEGSVESIDDTIGDYLIGALVRSGGTETYHSFIAEGKREDMMLRSFLDFVGSQTDYAIYHWHHYERNHLRTLMERHGMNAFHLLEPNVMFDLAKIATGAFTFPTYGNSIKDIAKWLGFKWRHDNVGATSSMELYMAYAEDPVLHKDKMQLVLDYNEDDCIATRVIKDWLVKKRAES